MDLFFRERRPGEATACDKATGSSGEDGVLAAADQQNSVGGSERQRYQMEPLHYPVKPPPGGEVPATTASSADAQICADGAAAEAGTADKAQSSEHSIEQIEPKIPGCTKRGNK